MSREKDFAPRERRNRQRLGLGAALGLAGGALALATALSIALAVGELASRQLLEDTSRRLQGQAEAAASLFEQGLDHRLGEMMTLVEIGQPLGVTDNPFVLRRWMDQLKANFPDYAWVGYAALDGTVVAASDGLLEGADVSSRPWFQAARRGPFIGDLHEAVLLANLLEPDGEEILRFLDVAAPLHDQDGRPAGVVAAHIDWRWARGLLLQAQRLRGSSMLVLARDGEVLHGPPELLGENLAGLLAAAAAAGERGLVAWPDGRRYLTARSGGWPGSSFLGLEWTVLARLPADVALAPARTMRWTILLFGLLIALPFALLTWAGARHLARPLVALAEAANRLRRGERPQMPPVQGLKEVGDLTGAFRAGVAELLRRQRGLEQAKAELERRVAERTADLSAANGALARSNRDLQRVETELRRDLEAAAEVQRALLPPARGEGGGWRAATLFRPSAQVSGDSFNYFAVAGEALGFYLLDVAGHGVRAGLLSVMVNRLLSPARFAALVAPAAPGGDWRLRRVPEEINAVLARAPEALAGDYITLICGLLLPAEGRLLLCSAGHGGALHLGAAGRAEWIDVGGVPLGVLEETAYEVVERRCAPGDRLLFVSDGVVECPNAEGVLLGDERLELLMEEEAGTELPQLVEEIASLLHRWRGTRSFPDDVSALAFEVTGRAV